MLEFLRSITAPSFVKNGGTSAQFLKADGSVDSNAYAQTNGTNASGTWPISVTGNATTATNLQTARSISMTGDVTWSIASFNGSANVTAAGTLANSGVTAGTYNSVTVDAKGRVTAGSNPTLLINYNLRFGGYGRIWWPNSIINSSNDIYAGGYGVCLSYNLDFTDVFRTINTGGVAALTIEEATLNFFAATSTGVSQPVTLNSVFKVDRNGTINTPAISLSGSAPAGSFTLNSSGNVVIGTAALSTSATSGFLWIPSCAGAPTGAPTAPYTNASALITDTTNNNFVHRSGSTWVTNTKLTGEGSALGWKDIIGVYVPHASGGPAPILTQVGAGFFYAYAFSVDDVAYYTFHINHDYAPGTNIFLHAHFMCSGTNTNSIVWEFTYSFAKGHNQATNGNFDATGTTVSKTYAMTTTAQYRHHVAEIDTGILGTVIEPDGILLVRVARRTNGGTNNTDTCFMLCSDVHYQMDRSATKNKAPSFYV